MTVLLTVGPRRVDALPARTRIVHPVDVGGERREWWIDVPDEHADALDPTPAGVLPTALVVAAVRGLDVSFADPVDPVQLAGALRSITTMATWWSWRVPRVHAAVGASDSTPMPTPTPSPVRPGRALCMSRGVDSLSTLVAGLDGTIEPFTHLVWIDGISPFVSRPTARRLWRDTLALSDEVGIPALRIATNLQDETERCVPWGRAVGAVTIGAALSVGGRYGSLVFSPTLESGRADPNGSHPEIDPGWSTSRTAVPYTDPYGRRIERLRAVIRRPDLVRHLHVCWEVDSASNCGRCNKCLQTATGMVALGAADIAAKVFGRTPDPEAIRALPPFPSVLVHDLIDACAERAPLLGEAWSDHARSSNPAGQWGAGGFDLRRRRRPSTTALAAAVPLGWGATSTPVHLPRSTVVPAAPDLDRRLRWCLLGPRTTGAAAAAAELGDRWGPGTTALYTPERPEVTGAAARRLLESATVRCWWSDEDRLHGPEVVESVESGCVPIQLAPDAVAERLRRSLPPDAGPLLVGLGELGTIGPDDLTDRWHCAVRLVTRSTFEDDLASSGVVP